MKLPKAPPAKTPDQIAVRALIKTTRKRRPSRIPPTPYPRGAERELKKLIRVTLRRLASVTRDLILPNLARWVGMRKDIGEDEELEEGVAQVEREQEAIFSAGKIAMMAALAVIGRGVALLGKKGQADQMKALTGVPYEVAEPLQDSLVHAWAARNYRLIKTVSQRYIGDLNRIVSEGLKQGLSAAALRESIGKLEDGLLGYQVDRLARDQVGKLNSTLSEARQKEAGFDAYVWSTSQDERVRGNPAGVYPDAIPSHWIMEGKICRWDDPSVYWDEGSGKWVPRTSDMPAEHAGYPINCRCVSLPFTGSLVEEERDEGI